MVVTVVRKLTPILRSVAREMISEARDGIEVERPNPIRLGTVETSRYGEGGYPHGQVWRREIEAETSYSLLLTGPGERANIQNGLVSRICGCVLARGVGRDCVREPVSQPSPSEIRTTFSLPISPCC